MLFRSVYQEAIQKATHKAADGAGTESKVNTPPTAGTADSAPETGGRRARRPKGEVEPPKEDQAADNPGEAPEPPDSGDDGSTGETDLPLCPDAERIFKQHADNPEIPLCPNIKESGRCCKEGGPDACPLWDRPKADDPAPKMDVNPPRRTRKKRGES